MKIPKALMVATTAYMIDQFNIPNIRILQQLGYEVTVACGFGEGNAESPERVARFRQKMREAGVRCVDIRFPRSPYKIGGMSDSYRKLKNLIDGGGYELVHCHTPVGGFLTRLAARKRRSAGKLAVIYTAHGFHFFKGAPLRNWLLYFPAEWLCAYWTDVLITINHEDYALAKKRMKARRVTYIPGAGIDLDRFSKSGKSRKDMRERLGVAEGAFVMLSVGELIARKGHSDVIRAMALLGDAHIKYYICGMGEKEDELKHMIHEKGLDRQITLLGFRTDVRELLEAADLFVFPSRQEGLPMALMEAMAAGIPVICSKIRGHVDLIDEGWLMFDPGDPKGLAGCVRRVRAAGRDAIKATAAAHREKLKQYDIGNVSRLIKKEYSSVRRLQEKTVDGPGEKK